MVNLRWKTVFFALSLGASGLCLTGRAAAQTELAAVAPVSDCAQMAAVDLSAAAGAPTQIRSARAVEDDKPAPYCEVRGVVATAIQFEVRLPLKGWTQRFLQTGCGGLCGEVSIRLGGEKGCAPATDGSLVLASTDMGHSGGMADDGSWGSRDVQMRVDFAYRGVHETALVAKALTAAFYGQGPKYSYFSGCSDGGREALMEAQRFPEDFNGITAGAPAMNFTTQNTFYHGYNVIANTDAKGQKILHADKLPLLHAAVLAACDANDGLKDGLISQPWNCHFDPTTLVCKKGQNPQSCLTAAEANTVRELYRGAHTADGTKLVLSGPLPGSELAWAGVEIPPPGGGFVLSQGASLSALKHLVYDVDPAASYTLKDLALTRENFALTTKYHSMFDATDTDLTPFAGKGGKLILWHGLADPHISPLNTIAYYMAVQKTMGEEKADGFTRLFLMPGGYHCDGGEGPMQFPLLAAIMNWVEKGEAPQQLLAAHVVEQPRLPILGVPGNGPGGPMPPMMMGPGPNAPVKIDRTRPVYPYPYQAQYTGKGSINEASSFVRGAAAPVDPKLLDWLGAGFYAPHYEQWCKGEGQKLVCSNLQ